MAPGDGLQWFGDKVQIKLRVSSMKRATAISEHLKKVEIKCQKVHDTVLKVLKFLCAFNICKITCNAPHSFIFLTFTVISIYMKESMQPSHELLDLRCQSIDEFQLSATNSLFILVFPLLWLPYVKLCCYQFKKAVVPYDQSNVYFLFLCQFLLWDMKYPRIL